MNIAKSLGAPFSGTPLVTASEASDAFYLPNGNGNGINKKRKIMKLITSLFKLLQFSMGKFVSSHDN